MVEVGGRSILWHIMKSTLLMALTQQLLACYAALLLTLSDREHQ